MVQKLLPTTVVGSYPQPDWLIDREALKKRSPPRVRARELWRVEPEQLVAACDDATRLAIRDMERAGIDIISDGEMRRESYSSLFANALEGIDLENPGTAISRRGEPDQVPRVIGPIKRTGSVLVRDVTLLRSESDHQIKITVPGPFTMSQQAEDDYYRDGKALAFAFADAVHGEIKDLFRAGADVVQLDEPFLQARIEPARAYGVSTINRALEGISGTTAVHLCLGYAALIKDKPSAYSFLTELNDCGVDQISIEAAQPSLDLNVLKQLSNKTIILGVLDLNDMSVESPRLVAARLQDALKVVPVEKLIAAPDCGMKYLPRSIAFGKLKALVEGARLVRGRV
ncbi:MAG: 5-methyltetrahydropteroyltriglutamate--homocysteine methyltransferase [Alphaproteobacteria bacterium]